MSLKFSKILLEALGYEYGCVMLSFNFPELAALQEQIDREDLYTTESKAYGLEADPHVTLLYGFHDNVDLEDIRKIITPIEFTNCTIQKASTFKSPNYDVLKFQAKAPYLQSINKQLKKLPHTSNFPDYKPHMTIAYLKKGLGSHYTKLFKGLSYDLVPYIVTYSDFLGNDHKLAINHA